MENTPAMAKVDQGENQVLSSLRRRRLPKAFGYVIGDMKEFAGWLKGICASIPWIDGIGILGGNDLLVLVLMSLVIFP